MARRYGQIVSAIWNGDSEFRNLDAEPQRLYLVLVTQKDISSAGVLPLTIRRWASYAANTTPDDIWAALKQLVARRYIVCDYDTEEVLVRTFVKWDGGYGNRKRVAAIRGAASTVASPAIRASLARELDALGIAHQLAGGQAGMTSDRASDRASHDPSDTPPDAVSDRASDMASEGLDDIQDENCPEFQKDSDTKDAAVETGAENRVSDRASDRACANRRVVSSYVVSVETGNLKPETKNTSSKTSLNATRDETSLNATTDKARRFDEFWQVYPRRVGKVAARKSWAKAITAADPDLIVAAAQRYSADPNRLPEYTAHPATWLNQGRWDDDPLPPRSTNRTASQNAADWLTIGREPPSDEPPRRAIGGSK